MRPRTHAHLQIIKRVKDRRLHVVLGQRHDRDTVHVLPLNHRPGARPRELAGQRLHKEYRPVDT